MTGNPYDYLSFRDRPSNRLYVAMCHLEEAIAAVQTAMPSADGQDESYVADCCNTIRPVLKELLKAQELVHDTRRHPDGINMFEDLQRLWDEHCKEVV